MQHVLNLSATAAKIALAAMLLLQFAVIILRHSFGFTAPWLSESVIYAHAAIFMLAAGWTLAAGRHVAVDVVSERLGHPRLLKVVGFALFLVPMSVGLFALSLPSVSQSWMLLEGSATIGGLPGIFVLKTLLPIFALLLLIGGIVQLLRRV